VRQAQNRSQSGLSRPTLKAPDRSRMHVSGPSQVVLGDAAFGAKLAQPPAEGNARGVRVLIEALVHPAMLDGDCQPVQSALVGSELV
jgi:hypothetical protein